ncbi:chemotaxis protein CheW [Thermomonas fusca]
MSASGTTLITKPDDGAMVDAYVDALLAMPLVPPMAAPASPVEPPSVAPAAPAEPTLEEVTQMEAEAAGEADSTRLAEVEAEVEVETAAGVDVTPELESEAEPGKETDDLREPETEAWQDDAQVFDDALAPADAAPAAAAPEPAWQPAQQAMPAARAPAPAAMLPPLAELDDDRLIQAAPAGQRWLRVAVGDDRYAVELLRVQEVVRLAPVIAVRGAVPSLLGVMNLRGRVVPVHDLGRWLRRMPVEPDERARIVVLEYQDELVGLLVTAVTDVVTLDTPQIEPPTPGLRDRIGMGIARTPGAPPTVLLDARVVFD